jgi:hypothetical protein
VSFADAVEVAGTVWGGGGGKRLEGVQHRSSAQYNQRGAGRVGLASPSEANLLVRSHTSANEH